MKNLNRHLVALNVFLVLVFALADVPSARGELPMLPRRGAWSERPATRWQDAMVTGNGTLGAMVFGNPVNERIVLNHERLYEPLLDTPCPVPDISGALKEVRRLMRAGNYQQGLDHFYEAAVDAGFPGIQWTDPYHPACAIVIDDETSDQAKQGPTKASAANWDRYQRVTDFRSAEVRVNWTRGTGLYGRRTFVSRHDNVVVHHMTADQGEKLRGRIRLVNQDSRKPRDASKPSPSSGPDPAAGGYHPPEIEVTKGDSGEFWLTYRCKYRRTERGYGVVTRVIPIGGKLWGDDARVRFDASEVLVITAIDSVENDALVDHELKETKQRMALLEADYDQLLARHVKQHQPLMDRVTFQLVGGDTEAERQLSNEKLIELQKQTRHTAVQPALLEKMFDMGRYTLICSSGEWPPNLMGIWNGDWRPKWSGDFTLDANVNLQIAGACLGALPEASESYGDLVLGLVDDWKTNAKNLYGCRGVMAGTRTDGRHNLHSHFSRGFPGHMWTAGAQWMVLPMFEHFQSTGDERYLREKLLPVMKEVVYFYEDFLQDVDENGHRVFVPSYSPENRPANTKCPASINATMDIACAKEALSNLIDVVAARKDLQGEGPDQVSQETLARWRKLKEELPPCLLAGDGALKEWAHPELEDNNKHRHVSHLYPVWPGHEINPEDTPELFQAALIAAENRGRGNGSAHGLAHMALIASRLKNATLVAGNLRFMLSNDYLLSSLFTFHNPGRIYNADMLHSLPAVVLEMLVYSKPGEIELLPALAPEFGKGSLTGLRCRNQTIVRQLKWDLEQKSIFTELLSPIDQTLRVRLRRGLVSATLVEPSPDEDEELVFVGDGVVELNLKANVAVSLQLQIK